MPKEQIKLTEVERIILEKRLKGYSICELDGNDLRVTTDKIMFRGAAISGSQLPQTEGFAEVISNEIIDFLNEMGYGELTLEEIILAFKFNAKGNIKFPSGVEIERVQFSGGCISVDFISRVLFNYMALRNILDRKLQNFIDGYE